MSDTRRTMTPRRLLGDEIRDQVASDLIFSGVVAAGEMLPSEHSLAARYGVSRVTVRAALRSLQEAGLLKARNGAGSIVMPRPHALVGAMDQLCSLETFARRGGHTVETSDPAWSEAEADEHVAEKLGLDVGATVVVVELTKVLDGTPVACTIDHIVGDVLELASLKDGFSGSVLDVLLAYNELGVEFADAEFTAMALDEDVALRLGVPKGTPGVFLDQLMQTAEGRIVQWAQTWLLPEHFRFVVRRRPPIAPPMEGDSPA